MNTSAQLLEAARRAKGKKLSDRLLGKELGGLRQQDVSRAKHGYMTDEVAMGVAKVLELDAAEVIIVARAERENTPAVRAVLLAYVKNALRSVSSRAASYVAVLAVALSAQAPNQAPAYVGGEGGIRTHVTA